jgi:2-oxoisovalerate dehydrogenase E1 component alpha subunit
MEAVFVGAASAMQPDDVLAPSFREHGALLVRGATPKELLLYWGGDERGNSYAKAPHDLPYSVPVGSHSAHATGVALAFKLRKQPRAAVALFGDGATSKGDVYESFNFAGVWKLPVVYVVNNNQWAISVPVHKQTAAQTLAQKAIAAGFYSEQVDGNDVIAVVSACKAALDRARNGDGPTMIEAITYRLSDHTTSDNASRYRSDAEVAPHWEEEPAKRLESYLVSIGKWSKDDQEHVLAELKAEMDAEADAYLKTPIQDVATIFDYTYATLPAELARQKEQALK